MSGGEGMTKLPVAGRSLWASLNAIRRYVKRRNYNFIIVERSVFRSFDDCTFSFSYNVLLIYRENFFDAVRENFIVCNFFSALIVNKLRKLSIGIRKFGRPNPRRPGTEVKRAT